MTSNIELNKLIERARSCIDSNNQGEAVRLLDRVHELDSRNIDAWLMLGSIRAQSADPAGAEQCYREVLSSEPRHSVALNRLAGNLLAMNHPDEAEQHCRLACGIDPGNAEIHANLGNILGARGLLPEAVESYRRAIELAPDFTGAYLNLANTLKRMGRLNEAVDAYRRVLEINPQFIDIYNALGECCLEAGKLEDSLEYYRTALQAAPDYLLGYMNMGFVLGELGRYTEALDCYSRVLELNPRQADACYCKGLIQKRLGHYNEAITNYRQALALQPDYLDARLSLSLLELLCGHYREGWRDYAARKSVRELGLGTPELLPEDLNGKKILVIRDQGIGDEIFFLRFARQLKERGGRVAYHADPKIRSLVNRLDFIDEVTDGSEPVPEYDIRLSVGDLPCSLDFDDSTEIPPPVALNALPSSRDVVQDILEGVCPGPYIGVTWWAGTRQQHTRPGEKLAHREVPVDLLAEILRPLGATLLVMQRLPEMEELQRLSGLLEQPVHDMSRFNDDLEGMLALLGLLDEYIGVDNTNMHLASSIGKPCRILVPHPPEWRMGTNGNASPWFPGFSLYRQSVSGDWSEALTQLGTDLAASLT